MKYNTINNIIKIVYIFLFIFITSTPLILTLFTPNSSVNIENREMNQLPSLTLISKGKVGEYMRLTQNYFNDVYNLKDRFIFLNSFIDYKFFKLSPKDSVAIGNDNWLFYITEDGVNMSDYYGLSLFTEDDLSTISNKMKNIDTKLSKKNIDFIVMMAPNKHTIYEEYLPQRIYNQKGDRTRADQYGPILEASGIKYIDLRNLLLESKSEHLLYYPLDSHWNDRAGMIAYKELAKNLNTPPKSTSKIPEINIGEKNRTGDLGNIIALSDILKDVNISVAKHYNYSILETKNKDIDQTITKNPNGDPRKVIVFKDSFIGSIIPFLSSEFSEVIYTSSPTIDFNLISQHQPDIVILQFVERYSNILLQNGNKYKQ